MVAVTTIRADLIEGSLFDKTLTTVCLSPDKFEKDFCIFGRMDHSPDLNAMALFARVLQHGSFSEASRRLRVPVSSISRKISDLERQLGVRLLERTTRAVKPTEAGNELLPSCQEILEALDGAVATVQNRQTEVMGTLRLATPPSLSDLLVVPLIHGFLQRYPKVSAKVLVTDRHLEMVEDEVDISLRVGRQADSSLISRPLLRYRHILVAAPSYIARAGAPSHPTELSHHRLIGFSKWFSDVNWRLSKGRDTERVPLRGGLSINDYAGVIRAAVGAMGIAEIPSIMCRNELQQSLLVPVMPDWQFEEVNLSAYYLSRRHPSRVVELFLAHCSANAESCIASPTESGSSTRERKSRKAPARRRE
jgi:DNA-binding transcriptional LysR family regulator